MATIRFLPVDARLAGASWQRFRSYRFAEDTLGAPVVASEVGLIASFAPFVFLRGPRDYLPYVLFSLAGERNAFVSPDGRWRGGYVPAHLRSHPFALSGHPDDDAIMVRHDAVLREAAPNAHPFLAAHGGLSEPVRKVQRFMVERRSEMVKTATLMRTIARLGLFARFTAEDLARNDKAKLFVIDWTSLNRSKAASAELSKNLALQRVLHAHAVSLNQLERVRALEADRMTTHGPHTQHNNDFEDFLDAVGGALRAG